MTGMGGLGFSSTSSSEASIAIQPPSAPTPAALASLNSLEVAGGKPLPLLEISFSLTREGGNGPSRRSVEL